MWAIDLLPQFWNVATWVVSLVAAISIIVTIHELGHLIVGRWTGIEAEIFSVGFGPVLASRMDARGTRWQVAVLPFGGFVKFLGDSNAASIGGDVQGMDEGERRHTMLGAPLWARSLTVAAGPVANFILAFIVYASVIIFEGQPFNPLTVSQVTPLPDMLGNDLSVGDEIISIENVRVNPDNMAAFSGINLPPSPSLRYEVVRDGVRQVVIGPWPTAPIVGQVVPRSAAREAGVHSGDVITAVDRSPIFAFSQLLNKVLQSDGRTLTLTIWREGSTFDVEVTPRRTDQPDDEGGFSTDWKIGVAAASPIDLKTELTPPIEASREALLRIGRAISVSVSAMRHMVLGNISTCNLSGPKGIGDMAQAAAEEGAVSFLWLLAGLSVAVGLMNLFPIPVLDGGHLVFHAYEAVTGRPPGDRALRVLMSVGLALILTLTLFGLANDIFLCP